MCSTFISSMNGIKLKKGGVESKSTKRIVGTSHSHLQTAYEMEPAFSIFETNKFSECKYILIKYSVELYERQQQQ